MRLGSCVADLMRPSTCRSVEWSRGMWGIILSQWSIISRVAFPFGPSQPLITILTCIAGAPSLSTNTTHPQQRQVSIDGHGKADRVVQRQQWLQITNCRGCLGLPLFVSDG